MVSPKLFINMNNLPFLIFPSRVFPLTLMAPTNNIPFYPPGILDPQLKTNLLERVFKLLVTTYWCNSSFCNSFFPLNPRSFLISLRRSFSPTFFISDPDKNSPSPSPLRPFPPPFLCFKPLKVLTFSNLLKVPVFSSESPHGDTPSLFYPQILFFFPPFTGFIGPYS